jgi:hypothetical protein
MWWLGQDAEPAVALLHAVARQGHHPAGERGLAEADRRLTCHRAPPRSWKCWKARESRDQLRRAERFIAPVVPAEPSAPSEQLHVRSRRHLLDEIKESLRLAAVLCL